MRIFRNIVLFFMLFIIFVFIYINLELSNIIVNSFTQFTKKYTDNIVISTIFKTAIFLDLLMILLIIFHYIFDWKKKDELKIINTKVLIVMNSILIFLIWFEIYYGTTFKHGFERTLLAINNSGLIGSLLFSLLMLILLKFENKSLKNKILVAAFFIVIIFFHLIVYKFYNLGL